MLVTWLLTAALAYIVFGAIFQYTYHDLPKWPTLRRLVLVFYFPLLFLLVCAFCACSCWERDENTPLMGPFLRFYWLSWKNPLNDYQDILG